MDRARSMMAMACVAGLSLMAGAAWDHGEPVTTYWFGPGCPGTNSISLAMTDAWAKQLKEGGFNTVWARTPEELEIAAKHGLRVIYSVDPKTEWAKIDLDDPAQKAALTERINRVKGHPALYIYEHFDEASADRFEELARVKEYIHELDPNHPCWHNLLPTYANHKQLGVGGKADEPQRFGFGGDKIASYWEHVRLFCEMYQPELITYDYYQFMTTGDKREYFLNLGIIRQNAAANRVPFWNGLQACTWVPGSLASPRSPRIPNVDEMRYLAHTTAAYGANGLYWYVYGRADHMGTIAAPDGAVGEKYEGVKKINREFIAFSRVLGRLDFKGAYMQGAHALGTTPYGDQALLKISPETPYSECKELQRLEDTTLVTRFAAKDGRAYLMVVNCDYKKDRTIRVAAPFDAERFDPATGAWSSVGKEFSLDLIRGGGVLLRAAASRAASVKVDFGAEQGAVKPLHGVNNAPVRVDGKRGQNEFKAAGIPYVRTHDTAGMWGGAHYVDIPNVFPDFDADENDPASYDFAFTDAYLKPLVEAGCRIFYRLGVTIENSWKVKAYNIHPPKDFAKWARVCEHVVRHYNEGWANGFRWGIEYWEIWNEPENPPMWQGTKEQFFEMYRVTANHLKGKFPGIKVGGYAGCGFYVIDDEKKRETSEFYRSFVTWFEDFCRYVQAAETKAPLDFFSWHLYVNSRWPVDRIATHAAYVRKTLDAAGLAKTESIFNEWNVFRGASDEQFSTAKTHVGAANVAAAFCLMQGTSIDKAMYYDALPTRSYCGLFHFPGMKTTPCYEAFRAWNELAKLGTSVSCGVSGEGVYAAAAKGASGRAFLAANTCSETVCVNVAGMGNGAFDLYRVDGATSALSHAGSWRGGEVLEIPPCGFVLALQGVKFAAAAKGDAGKARAVNGLQQ